MGRPALLMLMLSPAVVAGTTVSVYAQTTLDGASGCGNEIQNLMSIVAYSATNNGGTQTIGGTDYDFSDFVVDDSIRAFDQDDLDARLAAASFLFMVDMEGALIGWDATSQGKMKDFIQGGGVLVMTGTAGGKDADFLNDIFDWDTSSVRCSSSTAAKDDTNTAGTPFETGPATIQTTMSATDCLSCGTASCKAMYGSASNAMVTVFDGPEIGKGTVIFIGWDFFNAGRAATIPGGWKTGAATIAHPECGSGVNPVSSEILPLALFYAKEVAEEVAEAAEAAAPVSGEIFDDPHVRTLSGNQFFLHGVGVFDYATIPGVIKTQVYMCPFAPCTKQMMDSGDCLTFINAVAIKVENAHQAHTVVLRNSSLRVDNVDRKGDVNITLGGMVVTASGKGRATELPERVDHDSLSTCHQLPTAGQVVPKTQQLAAKRPIGGVWQDCTRNEWTMTTPEMAIEIGVIGPFEEGYLKEAVGDRTFNLDVRGLKNADALQGIINGDKNGLFVVDPELNPEPNAESGSLVPWGPHGNVQEVTAANVKDADVLFPKEAMEKLDAMCGEQQAMRGMLMKEGTSATKDQKDGWKNFKSRPRQHK